jgi:hypothetical protein
MGGCLDDLYVAMVRASDECGTHTQAEEAECRSVGPE